MEEIVKNLFDGLENKENPYCCEINRQAKEFLIKTVKAGVDDIMQDLLDRLANKDQAVIELEEANKKTEAIVKDLMEQNHELKTKNYKLEDEIFSLKKRIKLLLSLGKSTEQMQKDKTPTQYKTSSSLRSEGNVKSREQSSYSPSLKNYEQLNSRIKALEKGVNNLLDSPALKPSPTKEPTNKPNPKNNSNSSLIRSDKSNPLNYSSNILTFNPAYIKKVPIPK